MAPRRRLLLFGALALTLVAVFTVDREEAPPPARRAAPRAEPATEPRAAPAVNTVADLKRREYATARGDLFPPHTWLPPPVAATTGEGPSGPPPLPFTYLGRMLEGRETVVFLLFQEKTVAVRRADVIDGTYRVEQITPQSMVLVYLPLKEKQSLDFGSAN